MSKHPFLAATLLAMAAASPAFAQEASFIYRLGKDTVGLEHFVRTPTRLTGDAVSRQGVAVTRVQYDASIANGKVTGVTYRIFGPDGKPIANRPTEIRYEIVGDSARRTVVWPDSTPVRMLGAANAFPYAAPSYGMLELAVAAMRASKASTITFPVLGVTGGNALATIQLNAAGGDTIRQPSGLVLVVDKGGLLRSVDGSGTTQKIVATRSSGALNVAAMSMGMKPTGVLSGRGTVRAVFQTPQPGGVIMIDYGRPLVRERSVWGGLLVPPDTIWRLGANDATHFATARDLDFGNGITVPAGLYTLFLYNAKSGPLLVVNKQTGQWGTVYDQAKDLVRIPLTMATAPDFMEEFTIAIRQSAPNKGALEFGWGQQAASAGFTVKP